MATEMEIRQNLVNIAVSYYGYNEKSGTHKIIIDIYNGHKPLARGYKVQYTDSWCSTFVSTVAIMCKMTDIIPTECGCEQQINLFKKINCWEENDAYRPQPGDIIFYDWDDDGKGDNKGWSDHVGIVVSVVNNTIKIIEGNINNSVGYRTISVNSRFIRGYGVPNYKSKASTVSTTKQEDNEMACVRYEKISDVTNKEFRKTLDKLIEKGIFNGKSGEGEDRIIDLSEDIIRMLVILNRAGIFDK